MAAIFFDIDGTLLGKDHIVPEDTKEALKQLRANGHYLFVNTGRSRIFARTDGMPDLGFHGMIMGDGTCIEYEGEILLEKRLELNALHQAIALFDRYNRPMVLEGLHNLYVDYDLLCADERGLRYSRILRTRPEVLSMREHWDDLRISKFTAIIGDAPVDVLTDALKDDYEIINQDNTVLECVTKGYSKAGGITFICDYLNIPIEETYAFGDGNNDIQMLDTAGIGIVMANGKALAKQHADYITDAWDKGGIINACRHFGLI